MLRLAGWIAWWVALFWLWLLLSGEWNRVEIVAAAVAATLGASLAEGLRGFIGVDMRIPLRDFARAWSVPLIVLVDFGIVMWVLLTSAWRRELHRGRFVARDFDPAGGFGSRAWRTYVAMFSPNAYVIDADAERKVVLLHDLVPFRKSEEPAA
jgi:hypothetical protein